MIAPGDWVSWGFYVILVRLPIVFLSLCYVVGLVFDMVGFVACVCLRVSL